MDLNLGTIRKTLIRQEDTIIFALIERAQHAANAACYRAGEPTYTELVCEGDSFLDFMLLETERLHARVRRYTSPDEYAFFPDRLPAPQLPLVDFPAVLQPNLVNINTQIMNVYVKSLLPNMCAAGDDDQHGSAVVSDVTVLQAISKRVHYGFFVAEAKFRAQEDEYRRLILAEDEAGLMALLTNAAVEEKVLQRVGRKARTFGQEISLDGPSGGGAASSPGGPAGDEKSLDHELRVDPELIVAMYREHVIPLTKVAEVQYLLQRLGNAAVAYAGAAGSTCHRAALSRFGGAAPLRPCAAVADVFESVMSNRAFYGVAMLERGESGVLAATRALLRTSPLRVVGEVLTETRFRLLMPDTPLSSVRRVRGAAHALRLCTPWLRQLLGHTFDVETGGGSSDAPWAAWGPWAAGADGAPSDPSTAYVVEHHVEAAPGLVLQLDAPPEVAERARCIVIAKARASHSSPTGDDRTVVLFGLSDQPGSLAEALATLHRHRVNIHTIQSYADAEPGTTQAAFICDVDGHEADANMKAAFGDLAGHTAFVKVVGSFAIGAAAGPPPLSPRRLDSGLERQTPASPAAERERLPR